MEIKMLNNINEMAGFLADKITRQLTGKKPEQNMAIALSGGSTPKLIFDRIVLDHKKQLNWKRIRFFQVDERCVAPSHPQSNYAMLRHHLFKGLEIREDHIFRMHGEDDPNTEAVRYGRVMAENLPMQGKWPVFDFVLLGLGEDGHTASIFPGDADVLNSDKLCERTVHPQTGQVRITITLQVINHAKDVVFIVTGPEKAGIVADVILNPGKMAYPASHVNPLNGTLTWLLDPHASVRLH